MTGTALLAAIAAGTVAGAHLLSRARWTWSMPRAAIVLWQALGLAWGIATIGTLLGIAVHPYGEGIAGGLILLAQDAFAGRPLDLGITLVVALVSGLALALVLLGMLLYAVVTVVRARRRHRELLALVAHGEPSVPGTLVLDHPAAAAYCVPGVRSAQVVVSAGTLQLLDQAELAAVLEHERAHARERHDLVLLPFASLRQVFPRFGLPSRSLDAVALLVEMAADDRAQRHRPPSELATALLRFAAAGPAAAPSGALAVIELSDEESVAVPVSIVDGGGDESGSPSVKDAPSVKGAPAAAERTAGAKHPAASGPASGVAAGAATGNALVSGAATQVSGPAVSDLFGAYGPEQSPVIARVHRLIDPVRPQPTIQAAALCAAALIAVLPPLLYALPY